GTSLLSPSLEAGATMRPLGREYVEKRTSRGHVVGVWEVTRMPRIPNCYLDCAIYLYANKSAAERGADFGGSGFVAAAPSPVAPHRQHFYAVTARHVIEGYGTTPGCPVFRLNTETLSAVVERVREDWVLDPKYDIAVCPFDPTDPAFR